MKDLWQQFKAFALKGNMIDLAIAVVIGAAFAGVINSLVKNVIMPAVSYAIPNQGGYLYWHIGRIMIGPFIGELLNFFIIAAAVFLVMVKLLGTLLKKVAPPPPPATRDCPECLSAIPVKARRCAHCTCEVTPQATA